MAMYHILKQSVSSLTRFYTSPTGGVTLQVLRVEQEVSLDPEDADKLCEMLSNPDAPIAYEIADDNPFLSLDGEPDEDEAWRAIDASLRGPEETEQTYRDMC